MRSDKQCAMRATGKLNPLTTASWQSPDYTISLDLSFKVAEIKQRERAQGSNEGAEAENGGIKVAVHKSTDNHVFLSV